MYVSFGTGIPDRIEYTPGSGSRVLVPDAELQLCDMPCDTDNVSVRLSLATHHIGKGCDRDTYSVESQRKLCGECYTCTVLSSDRLVIDCLQTSVVIREMI